MRFPRAKDSPKIEFCMIGGWFMHPEKREGMAFAGYFRHNPSTGEVRDGQLVDTWGKSTIDDGYMDDERLIINKTYAGRERSIQYDCVRLASGLWAGIYKCPDRTRGKMECKVRVIDRDAFDLVCGER